MKNVDRKDITDETYREILDVETHHDHIIIEDEHGTLRWKEDPKLRNLVDHIGVNEIWHLFHHIGLDKNDEPVRKMYRDMGYSLFGYWEVFYWEANNDRASEYMPSRHIGF